MAWNKCLSWQCVEMKEWRGTKWRLGHFRLMLTSKLATAGQPGLINSHNKKSWCWPRSVCNVNCPALGPQGQANNNLQLSETQKVSTRRALQFPQTAGPCHIKLAISHKFCLPPIHPPFSRGTLSTWKLCRWQKDIWFHCSVCWIQEAGSCLPDKGEQTGPL